MKKIILLASVMALFSIQNVQAQMLSTYQDMGDVWTNPGTQTVLTCATTGKPGPCPNDFESIAVAKPAFEGGTVSVIPTQPSVTEKKVSGSCPNGTHKSNDGCCCIND